MSLSEASNWAHYPMGPNLRAAIGIADDDYRGFESAAPTAAEADAFEQHVINKLDAARDLDPQVFVDLICELVQMQLPNAALRLYRGQPELQDCENYQLLLAYGSAAMQAQDLQTAETALRDAQSLAPEEPAAYVNLGQIFLFQNRDSECLEWCTAGLDADRNNRELWELIAALFRRNYQMSGDRLRTLADQRRSWTGTSLAAEILAPEDPMLKVQMLEDLHSQGEQSEEFLVEYTAALGMALQYEKIPPVVWQAERLGEGRRIPWQLYTHAAQAQLGLEKEEEANLMFVKALADPNLPEAVRSEIQTMREAE